MDEKNALIEQRKSKLAALQAKGFNPFAQKFVPTEKCAEARHNYVEGRAVAVAGRMTAHREMGKSQFIDLKDQSGRIQVYAQKQALGDEQWEIFKHLDLGDFVGARGTLFEDFEVTGAVFEKLIEPTLIQPTFVTHLPKELVPLAKLSPDDPSTVEVFECCINGQEIAPAYTEQNDPIEQRDRLEHQAGGEQQKLDEDFLVALEHGMPPAGGMGLGIDRLCMMLLGQESIRDVILFPQLKPK